MIGSKIDGGMPIKLLQVDRMKSRIGDAQQPLAFGRNLQRHVSRSVAGCRDGAYTRHDLFLAIQEVDFPLNRRKVRAGKFYKDFSEVLIKFLFGLPRDPEIPLALPHNVASVGKSWLAVGIGVPANVVWMPMRENDRVNVLRSYPHILQVLHESSCGWGKAACTRINQYQMFIRFSDQTDVRARPIRPLLWLQAMFDKHLLKILSWRVGK